MSGDAAGAALGAVLCGAAGLLVPALIARIPDPEPDGERVGPVYAPVAARPGLAVRSAVLAAVAGALAGGAVGLSWPLLVLLPLVPVGVALAVVDQRTHLLPTVVVWPTLAGAVVLGTLGALLSDDLGALVRAGAAAAVGWAFFEALWLSRRAGMGYGDVRLSVVVGFVLGYLGWPELVVGLYAGFVAFALVGLGRALARRDRGLLKVPFPYGPFLLGGALAGVVAGEPLWRSLVSG